MSYAPDAKKDAHAPFDRLLHELGVKELTPVPKLSVTRSSLPENVQVVPLDSRARQPPGAEGGLPRYGVTSQHTSRFSIWTGDPCAHHDHRTLHRHQDHR